METDVAAGNERGMCSLLVRPRRYDQHGPGRGTLARRPGNGGRVWFAVTRLCASAGRAPRERRGPLTVPRLARSRGERVDGLASNETVRRSPNRGIKPEANCCGDNRLVGRHALPARSPRPDLHTAKGEGEWLSHSPSQDSKVDLCADAEIATHDVRPSPCRIISIGTISCVRIKRCLGVEQVQDIESEREIVVHPVLER